MHWGLEARTTMSSTLAGLAAGLIALLACSDAQAQQSPGRFSPLTEDQLTAEQRAIPSIQRALEAGRYNPVGFDAVLARNPGLQDALNEVAAEVYPPIADTKSGEGSRPTIPLALTEIAILTLAQAWDFPAMFRSHGPTALEAGVSQEAITALAKGERPTELTADQEAVYDFTAGLAHERAVSDAAFANIRRFLSEREVVDLVGLLGAYTTSLMMLTVAGNSSH